MEMGLDWTCSSIESGSNLVKKKIEINSFEIQRTNLRTHQKLQKFKTRTKRSFLNQKSIKI
jgi:hypothetical protein